MGPLPPGISGATALNPGLAFAPPANVAALDGSEVPLQEGWLKLRGIPFNVAKPDIIAFFQVRTGGAC